MSHHPLSADYGRALDQIADVVGELSSPNYRAWAWQKCTEALATILESEAPPSKSLCLISCTHSGPLGGRLDCVGRQGANRRIPQRRRGWRS
jgi:hypothetical protein